ncbi:MAG: hypothetical protein M0P12_04900, partial [Paludibacteraceae bacterium]|nr:hypothetical protein [Paludibacteraceae bacterium]
MGQFNIQKRDSVHYCATADPEGGRIFVTYGSICVVQHALICDKCWWFERFKTFRAKIEQCNFSIG